jgi:PAS domain S-box-containing protein
LDDRDKQPVATVTGVSRRGLITFTAGAVVVSVGTALAARLVSPVWLGAGLALYFAVLALFLFKTRRRLFTYARWRDVMPCHLSVQDERLRIIDSNDLFRRDFGDREGEYCFKVYKGDDGPCPDCPILKTFQDGETHTHEETVITKDGSKQNVIVTSAPLLDDSGKVRAVVEMFTNVTELRQLQQALDRTQREYVRLFEQVPCHIAVVDRSFQVVRSNALYRRDFDETRGDHCYEICKSRSKPCSDCLVAETFNDGKPRSREENLMTRDGRRVNALVHTMPIYEDGEIVAVEEMFTDITEVKRLQKQLALMGRAVAGMAHRVKNILMGLEGGIFVVNTGMEENDREQTTEGWDMVQRNVKRVSTVVMELLYCAKDRQPSFQDDVCPQEILQEVCELYSSRFASDAIAFRLEKNESPHRDSLDPEGLHSLLSNLVGNAVDACRFDPDQDKASHTITMRCGLDEDGATVLEVGDDGAGIPEELSGKVFEDFFSTKGTEGTGLGLLVVQKVAEEHGGSVTYESAPGEGTLFRVTIPRRATRLESGSQGATEYAGASEL